jgi:multidrug efflux pump subunit AcrB
MKLFSRLFITLALVFIVVYIFLQDFRSTLIPMIAVPVALIGTFFFLWVFGFSVNSADTVRLAACDSHSGG